MSLTAPLTLPDGLDTFLEKAGWSDAAVEPLAGDASFRRKAQARIEAMMKRCKLIAIVSHSTDFLRRLSTHALWLDGGRLRDFGEAEAVLGSYDAVMGKGGEPEPDTA